MAGAAAGPRSRSAIRYAVSTTLPRDAPLLSSLLDPFVGGFDLGAPGPTDAEFLAALILHKAEAVGASVTGLPGSGTMEPSLSGTAGRGPDDGLYQAALPRLACPTVGPSSAPRRFEPPRPYLQAPRLPRGRPA